MEFTPTTIIPGLPLEEDEPILYVWADSEDKNSKTIKSDNESGEESEEESDRILASMGAHKESSQTHNLNFNMRVSENYDLSEIDKIIGTKDYVVHFKRK